MTVIRKCKKCRKEYRFQEHGHGVTDESNDPDFCPQCLTEINSQPD